MFLIIREIQTKTTMSYDYTPVGKIKNNTDNTKCWRKCRESIISPTLPVTSNSTVTLKESLVVA